MPPAQGGSIRTVYCIGGRVGLATVTGGFLWRKSKFLICSSQPGKGSCLCGGRLGHETPGQGRGGWRHRRTRRAPGTSAVGVGVRLARCRLQNQFDASPLQLPVRTGVCVCMCMCVCVCAEPSAQRGCDGDNKFVVGEELCRNVARRAGISQVSRPGSPTLCISSSVLVFVLLSYFWFRTFATSKHCVVVT